MRSQQTENNLRMLGLSIALSLAILGGLSGYWSFSVSGTANSLQWWGNWLQDVGTEMLGAAVTILLVELVIYQKRDEVSRVDRARTRRQEHLIEQLRRTRKTDQRQKILDRMARQNLLSEAWLYSLDLSATALENCDLSESDLYESNLKDASLSKANLQGISLRRSNLSYANLQAANLAEADLVEANLVGADLYQANLVDADFNQARFDYKTRLPDGTFWIPDVDVGKFTKSQNSA
ncbi:MAG: pentapeptide repeat-containing protein [Cyanobacteria bacterium P01_C01_bin.120]